MFIPGTDRKRALIVVDIQPGFLNVQNNKVIDNAIQLLHQEKYDLYVEAIFHAEKGSLWETQQDWILPKGDQTHTEFRLAEVLKSFDTVLVTKETKSVFKGHPKIEQLLRQNGIEEVHVVGLDTNDCVLASAYEAFDLGFLTYVIEECCGSSASESLHDQAISLLRHQNMTNHSIKS